MSKIIEFLKEVKVEFKNITWPKRETLIQLTFVVISISIIVSLILGGFDYLFTNALNLLDKAKSKPIINTKIEPTIVPISPVQIITPTITKNAKNIK